MLAPATPHSLGQADQNCKTKRHLITLKSLEDIYAEELLDGDFKTYQQTFCTSHDQDSDQTKTKIFQQGALKSSAEIKICHSNAVISSNILGQRLFIILMYNRSRKQILAPEQTTSPTLCPVQTSRWKPILLFFFPFRSNQLIWTKG